MPFSRRKEDKALVGPATRSPRPLAAETAWDWSRGMNSEAQPHNPFAPTHPPVEGVAQRAAVGDEACIGAQLRIAADGAKAVGAVGRRHGRPDGAVPLARLAQPGGRRRQHRLVQPRAKQVVGLREEGGELRGTIVASTQNQPSGTHCRAASARPGCRRSRRLRPADRLAVWRPPTRLPARR